jgi:hypothetical protein
MNLTGRAPQDITAALGVIVALSKVAEESNDGSPSDQTALLGARAVHFAHPSDQTLTYSLSSHAVSIDACVIRFCSCGHRCSGTYTPRVTTCSIEAVPRSEIERPMSSEENEERT